MLQSLFVILLLVVGVILTLVSHFSRSSSLLRSWADQHGLRIIRKEYRTFLRGPFFWTSSKGQTVYRVIVEDKLGNQRSGWVRCGSWWFGLLSSHVEARGDEEHATGEHVMRDRWLDG